MVFFIIQFLVMLTVSVSMLLSGLETIVWANVSQRNDYENLVIRNDYVCLTVQACSVAPVRGQGY